MEPSNYPKSRLPSDHLKYLTQWLSECQKIHNRCQTYSATWQEELELETQIEVLEHYLSEQSRLAMNNHQAELPDESGKHASRTEPTSSSTDLPVQQSEQSLVDPSKSNLLTHCQRCGSWNSLVLGDFGIARCSQCGLVR